MNFFENIKKIFKIKQQKQKEMPVFPVTNEDNDAMWILNNINLSDNQNYFVENTTVYTENVKAEQKTQVDVVDVFIREISKGAGNYDIQKIENCIFKAEDMDIPPATCELLLNVLETQINKLERKGAANHWKEEYTDLILDLNSLFPTPYTHSNLLGINEKKINQLKQRLKELNKNFC